ncbi:hypothetical protein U9M48_024952 [Paspalum notatum var. saurae]|uniref:Protein Lines C-terminal domain-containing protein n=1 Tax=Paspalum notatum var. saurae TaxID=547442 RepID=A0AAQ3WX29_PASNO
MPPPPPPPPPPEKEKRHLARLCDLVSSSLLLHLEYGSSPPRQLTPKEERHLLLALSTVNKTIRRWDLEEELGCQLDQEIVSGSGELYSCCLLPEEHPHDGVDCLTNIVTILVGLLGFCSNYVKHSASNILITISSTLTKFESIWIEFIELVWVSIHEALKCVCNALCSTTDSKSDGIASSNSSITSFMTLLNNHCLGIDEQTMSSLFRVLHAILKFLKHSDSDLKDEFISLSIHHIGKMPWDSFHRLHAGELVSCAKDRFSFCNDSAQSRVLTGRLLQLLCSLLEQSYLELESTDGQDMFVKLVDIVPKIAASLQEQHDGPKSLYQYLKHKILDDMLFSILLQLLDAPLIFLKVANTGTTELSGVKLFLSIFDPVHIFHQLLFLLHYDHMVLIDYLISKDVGVHCAQYLLRCLRLVSQSWHSFVDDSVYLTEIEKLECKRQRTSRDISRARASSSKEHKNGYGCDKEANISQKLFLKAKACLYSLKRTLEDLQKKGLFPYNPKPLLRSLARFEELCEQR